MKSILVINDFSAEAEHAAELALSLARNTGANLLLWNAARVIEETAAVALHASAHTHGDEETVKNNYDTNPLLERLIMENSRHRGFKPIITSMNTYSFTPNHLADVVVKQPIWMIVKGIAEYEQHRANELSTQSILSKACCPLLLVPQSAEIKDLEKIVYTADLRYCRLEVLQLLKRLAQPFQSQLLVAHMPAKGLPDISDSYAATLFTDEICSNIDYENLYFNHIKETDVPKAMDVLINAMHTDLLVLINRRFHFDEIMGSAPDQLPAYLTVPVLVFPC